MNEESYVVDGVRYDSIDDVPEPMRSRLRDAIGRLGSGEPVHIQHTVESQFEVDGEVYTSLEEIPEPQRSRLRDALADRDGDGTPDVLQQGGASSNMFVVDGVRYASIDDVPEPQRAAIAEAFGHLDHRSASPPSGPVARARPAMGTPTPKPIVERAGWSNRTKLLVGFMALDVVAVAVIIWLVAR